MVSISQAQFDALNKAGLSARLLPALLERDEQLLLVDDPQLALLARHCAQIATAFGFWSLKAAVYFSLLMLRLHPGFYREPEIAAALDQMKREGVRPDDAPSQLNRLVSPEAWNRAIEMDDGPDAYWRRMFDRERPS